MIYFDHNASTPLRPEVLEVMMPFLTMDYANPSSVYTTGRLARKAIDSARLQVADLINAHPSQIVFTSGGSEANNLAIKGCIQGMGLSRLLVGAIEHPSVRDVSDYLSSVVECTDLAVSSSGLFSKTSVERWAAEQFPGLASIMLANNETGVIQQISEFGEILQNCGHYVHSDVTQAVGKIDVDFNALNVNLLTLSSHKIYGPKGAGALVFDKSIDLQPMIHGGGQEKSLRSGTENVAAIVGFGKAAELAKAELNNYQHAMVELREYFEIRLKRLPGVTVFAEESPRLANTSYFGLAGIDGETLLMQLDLNGVAVASGSACASKHLEPSHVLMAMNVEESLARSAIRVSFGRQNTKADIDQLINILEMQVEMIASLAVMDN